MNIKDLRGNLFSKKVPPQTVDKTNGFRQKKKRNQNENEPLNTVRFHSAIFRNGEVDCRGVQAVTALFSVFVVVFAYFSHLGFSFFVENRKKKIF